VYGSAYNYNFHKEQLHQLMRGRKPPGGASIWFKLLAKPRVKSKTK
jgi:hypothetical protein